MSETAPSPAPMPRSPRRSTAEIYITALWFALVTGCVHVGVLLFRFVVLDRFVRAGRDVLWMAPVAESLVFGALATGLVVVALVAPRRDVARGAIYVFAFLAAFLTLLLFARLHQYASLALAVGIAVQAGGMIARERAGAMRFFVRSGVVLWGVVVVSGLTELTWRQSAEARWARTAPPPARGAPNVLLLILDTVRASSMSLYGHTRPTTPALERWAARGVVFDMALAPSSWTLPSHASMFTGQRPLDLSARWLTPLDDAHPTVAEVFRGHGYRTGGFAGNLYYATYESGLARGMTTFEGYRVTLKELFWNANLAQTALVRGLRDGHTLSGRLQALRAFDFRYASEPRHQRKPGDLVVRQFMRWLDDGNGDRPFFAFLNLFDAHDPFALPEPYRSTFAAAPTELDAYDGAIAYLDAQVDTLLTTLERRGVLENTIVVIASDHGEQFGEHGLTSHGNSLYLPLVHVPLMVLAPGRAPMGMRVATPVSLRALAATLIDLADLGSARGIPGRSLAATWDGTSAEIDPVHMEVEGHGENRKEPISYGDLRAYLDARYHFIRRADGHEELYRYRRDPGEAENLIASPEGRVLGPAYRARLSAAGT